ncbi:hypothetical protein TSTA_046450 [Talaromyces stipitatus ATCC 10500]|uniref:Uncharacterized protein n=1 Tax=Talaromyces stipitatus (strain ATCC 10500 / CBS 375.48 / QM 6759 / NRRL 1006) TaxID=441959 RepID=B8MJJ1_TALSN|nr:uncharacterized protein TSTA_046450 [Talaromyces stipitatus ATCC 10500]EED15191.1 hypothetical protein TSTA_046450 [Talaromyces stipitatus ATCC 10500]
MTSLSSESNKSRYSDALESHILDVSSSNSSEIIVSDNYSEEPPFSTFSSSQASLNDDSNDTSRTIPDSQESRNNTNPEDEPISITYKNHILVQLSKDLSRLPAENFNRLQQVQETSSFWIKLFHHLSTLDSQTPPLKSREWAEYTVESSRVLFQAGLSTKKIVSILNHTIRYIANCILNTDNKETIFFENGLNVFYEPECCGIPDEMKVKYMETLEHLRDLVVRGGNGVIAQPEDEDSDDSVVSAASTVSVMPSIELGERIFQSIELQENSHSRVKGIQGRQKKNRGHLRKIGRFTKGIVKMQNREKMKKRLKKNRKARRRSHKNKHRVARGAN